MILLVVYVGLASAPDRGRAHRDQPVGQQQLVGRIVEWRP